MKSIKTILIIMFFGVFIAPLSAKVDLEKANKHYEKAYQYFKEDRKKNHNSILVELFEARDTILAEDNLSSSSEELLVKINALIYWTSKFSTIEQSSRPQRNQKPSTEKSQSTKPKEDLSAGKKEVVRQENREIEKILSDESEQKSADHLLKLMAEYEKTEDMLRANQIQEVIEKSYNRLLNEHQEFLEDTLKLIDNHDQLLKRRKYEDLSQNIKKVLKQKSLSMFEEEVLYDYYIEKYVLSKIISEMMSGIEKTIILPESKVVSFKSFIYKVDDKGLELRSMDLRGSIFLDWKDLDEKTIFTIGNAIFAKPNQKQKTYLAISLFGIGKYQEAFDMFKEVIDKEPKRYDLFKNYLTKCEIKYRIETSDMIEKVYERSSQLIKQNKFDNALKFMTKFRQKVMTQSLGIAFHNRLSSATRALVSEKVY